MHHRAENVNLTVDPTHICLLSQQMLAQVITVPQTETVLVVDQAGCVQPVTGDVAEPRVLDHCHSDSESHDEADLGSATCKHAQFCRTPEGMSIFPLTAESSSWAKLDTRKTNSEHSSSLILHTKCHFWQLQQTIYKQINLNAHVSESQISTMCSS